MKNGKFKKALSGAFATALVAGMTFGAAGVPVHAAAPADVVLTKELRVALGVDVPTATFNFSCTPKTDGDYKKAGPAITIDPVSFSPASAVVEAGYKTSIANVGDFIPAATEFESAGVYQYEIKELESGFTPVSPDNGETMAYSKASYLMNVQVVNENGTLVVKDVTLIKTANDAGGNQGDKIDPTDPEGDGSALRFVNEYSKNAGSDDKKDPENPDQPIDPDRPDPGSDDYYGLYVNKILGTYGQDGAFPFTITITGNGLASMANKNVKLNTSAGTTAEIVLDASGNGSKTFTLKGGEYAWLSNLPAGLNVRVEETNALNNDKVSVNGGSFTVETGANAAAGTIGLTSNKVSVTNDNEVTVPTGILINNLPFIVLISVVMLGFAAFVVNKKRRFS